MKKIKITLLPDGAQRIEVLGASGDECEAFTRELERRLGRQVGERTRKAEHEETSREAQAEREREG